MGINYFLFSYYRSYKMNSASEFEINEVLETEKMYKLYLIKCSITNKTYVGYTDSVSEKYNPVSYLYNQYKKSKTRYIKLGESIIENKFGTHKFMYAKENLKKDEAAELSSCIKEKLGDNCLNDILDNNSNFFKDVLDLL